MPTWKFAPKIKVRSISPYSVRMRENADQKKLRIWTLHTVEALDLNKILAKLCLSKTVITAPFYVLLGHQKQH